MQKGIVMFITLMFILVISTLSYYTLQQTDQYINHSTFDYESTQTLLLHNNLQKEIKHLLVQNKKTILQHHNKEMIENISFKKSDIAVSILFEPLLNKYNINRISNTSNKNKEEIEELFEKLLIPNYYEFKELVFNIKKQYKIQSFSSQKQINTVIKRFVPNDDQMIKTLEKYLTYQNFDSDEKFVKCTVISKMHNMNAKSLHIYDIQNDMKVIENEFVIQ